MYFVLYDRNLKSLGETYILESWSRTQRATDFDDMKIVGEQIPISADPFFVVVNDRQGKMKFSGLASTPIVDDLNKKTSISLKDYATLFNTEIIIDWSKFRGTKVSEYLDFILSTWIEQTAVGFSNIKWDVSGVDCLLDSSINFGDSKENALVKELVFDAINFYDLFYNTELDLYTKSLTFIFRDAGVNKVQVRLKDFGVDSVEKSFGEYNRATVYDHNFVIHQTWALFRNNSVSRINSVSVEIGGVASGGGSLEKAHLEMYLLKGDLSVGDRFEYNGEEAEVIEYEEGMYTLSCLTGGYFYSNLHSTLSGIRLGRTVQIDKSMDELDLVYPAKNRNFVASDETEESLYEEVYNAVMGLAENRYQENIDLNAQQYKSVVDLTSIDFSYRVAVYTEDGYYKDLPVGEIETDHKGKHIVRLGYRVQELTQEI